jgi:hypothetical protein
VEASSGLVAVTCGVVIGGDAASLPPGSITVAIAAINAAANQGRRVVMLSLLRRL